MEGDERRELRYIQEAEYFARQEEQFAEDGWGLEDLEWQCPANKWLFENKWRNEPWLVQGFETEEAWEAATRPTWGEHENCGKDNEANPCLLHVGWRGLGAHSRETRASGESRRCVRQVLSLIHI